MQFQSTTNHQIIANLRNEILYAPYGTTLQVQSLEHEEKDTSIYTQHGEQIVAACMVKHISNNIAKIRQIAILPAFENELPSLVDFAVDFCKANQYKSIVVNATAAQSAIFESRGFEKTGSAINHISKQELSQLQLNF